MTITRSFLHVVAVVAVASFLGCGGPDGPAAAVTAAPATAATAAATTPASRSAKAPALPADPKAPPKEQPDLATIFARLRSGLGACYEKGKKSTPAMLDGKLTLNASIDARGKPTCVIPSYDTGLTQEVEDCMSERFASEKFDEGAPWTVALPIVVRAGVLAQGDQRTNAGIDSIETFRMADAFEVLESLVPELEACMRGAGHASGLRTVVVGARVGLDGRAQCALASTSGMLPSKVGDCAAGVLRAAKFPPPKGGPGLVLVPITLSR